MRAMSDFVKEWLVPGTLSCLLGGMVVGIALLNIPATATLGRVWLTLLAVAYLLLSMPAVSSFLIDRMEPDDSKSRNARRSHNEAARADALIVVGNAPTALFRLLEMLDEGAPKPAAVIGMPVGFVGAAESKEALATDGRVPFAIIKGRKGGSAMAAAAVNALASEAE